MSPGPQFGGHLVVQQRVLPTYRVPFFERLAADCHRLTVLAGMPRQGEAIVSAERLDGAEWLPLTNRHLGKGGFYLLAQSELVSRLNSLAPDAVVLEANPRYLSTWRARSWAKGMGTPVLGWGLGAEPEGQMATWVWRRFLRGFDAMIAYSTRGAEAYRDLGVPGDRITLAINAVGAVPDSAPSKKGEPSKRLRLLFVGRLQRRKRIDTLLRACSRLAEPPAVTIVGDGPEGPKLKALAASVLPDAQFAGHLEGGRLEATFAQADLFVLPGTGGLAVQQAMAHGLPVIVGEGDGTADDLVRSANGWRVAPGDEVGLVEVLGQAGANRDRLARMGAESYRIVAEEVNLDAMARAFMKSVTNAAGGG